MKYKITITRERYNGYTVKAHNPEEAKKLHKEGQSKQDPSVNDVKFPLIMKGDIKKIEEE